MRREIITGEQAQMLMGSLGIVLHCFDFHTFEMETRDGETCCCWCAPDCTATVDVIFREPLPSKFDSRDLLVTILKAMWDHSATCAIAPNGIELRCVDKTIRIAAVAPVG